MTVTLFAFSAGQELSEPTAPFDALLLVMLRDRSPDPALTPV